MRVVGTIAGLIIEVRIQAYCQWPIKVIGWSADGKEITGVCSDSVECNEVLGIADEFRAFADKLSAAVYTETEGKYNGGR